MTGKWLQRIFSGNQGTTAQEWRTENSLYDFISSNLDAEGRFPETAPDLPDEEKKEGKLTFAPGLIDALFGASDTDESRERILALVKCLKKVATSGDRESESECYTLVSESGGTVNIIDEFLTAIVKEALPVQPYLFKFSKDLATRSGKRNAVKFGIAILGLCQNKSVIDDLKILGLHDEFTIFAAVAITSLSDNSEKDLWEMAQKVDGWGKIQLVSRLAKPNLDEPIKKWLILDGYRNNIMFEYLAYTCAVNGELHNRLREAEIDRKLFKAASDLIQAMISAGDVAEDMSEYPYASQVITDFLRHAKTHATAISHFNALKIIEDYLCTTEPDTEEQDLTGWDIDILSNSLIDVHQLLHNRDWKAIAQEGLKSDDKVIYWNAKHAAEKLGIDLWETVWKRLQENPLDHSSWFDVTRNKNPEYAEAVITFALQHLPFDELSVGAADMTYAGPNHSKHASLEYATTFLADQPGKGEKIILAALRSPLTRNRNIAIHVLEQWAEENWSREIRKEIVYLSEAEPNTDTKAEIQKLLSRAG